MAKSNRSKDEEHLKVLEEELSSFKQLIKGHEKILKAIGEL